MIAIHVILDGIAILIQNVLIKRVAHLYPRNQTNAINLFLMVINVMNRIIMLHAKVPINVQN